MNASHTAANREREPSAKPMMTDEDFFRLVDAVCSKMRSRDAEVFLLKLSRGLLDRAARSLQS